MVKRVKQTQRPRKHSLRNVVIGFLTAMVGLYLLLCLGLWHYQEQMIFVPDSAVRNTPASLNLIYEDVSLPVGTGSQKGTLHGWWIPTINQDAPALLYLHGNGSNIGDLVSRASQLHQWGYNILMIDYRGYGLSSGPFPNEQRVYEDAEAAWRHLREERKFPAENIVIYGRSLGGAIAINLATQHPTAAGTLLEATFTAMKDMVKYKYPFLPIPIDWLLKNKFESIEKVQSFQMPLILIHGTVDKIVPPLMSQTLYQAVPPGTAKDLVWIENGDHNNLPTIGEDRYANAVKAFIDSVT